jgi:adenylate cyclase class 2
LYPFAEPASRQVTETEIKFVVEDLGALRSTLLRIGFREVTPRTHELNTIYDRPGQPLRRRGELLRLRNYGGKWLLTYKSKGQSGRHKVRKETETYVSDGARMDRILGALGYRPRFRYEKFRSEWTDGHGQVVVDESPIGNFAEIEGAPEWIDEVARRLGITRSQYITKNYAELFRDWKRRSRSKAEEMTFAAIGSGTK